MPACWASRNRGHARSWSPGAGALCRGRSRARCAHAARSAPRCPRESAARRRRTPACRAPGGPQGSPRAGRACEQLGPGRRLQAVEHPRPAGELEQRRLDVSGARPGDAQLKGASSGVLGALPLGRPAPDPPAERRRATQSRTAWPAPSTLQGQRATKKPASRSGIDHRDCPRSRKAPAARLISTPGERALRWGPVRIRTLYHSSQRVPRPGRSGRRGRPARTRARQGAAGLPERGDRQALEPRTRRAEEALRRRAPPPDLLESLARPARPRRPRGRPRGTVTPERARPEPITAATPPSPPARCGRARRAGRSPPDRSVARCVVHAPSQSRQAISRKCRAPGPASPARPRARESGRGVGQPRQSHLRDRRVQLGLTGYGLSHTRPDTAPRAG